MAHDYMLTGLMQNLMAFRWRLLVAHDYEGHFYVRRIGRYLYKYRIYGTVSIYILKSLAFVYQLI